MANHFLQAVLDETQKKNQDLRTENSPLRTTQVIQDVLSGLLDYGVCFSPHGHPELEKKVLYTGQLKVVVSKHHPLVKLAKKKEFKFESLNDYPATIHKFSAGVDYCENHPAFKQFGIQPKVFQYFHSDELCVQSLLTQNLWTLVPDVVENFYKAELFSIPLPKGWDAPYEISTLYRKTMKNRAIFMHLDERLKEQFTRK